MSIFRRWLSRFDAKEIGDGKGSVFFRRYHLLTTRRGSVFLHEFLRGDTDRCLHDHPWDFVVVILKGGYWETMVDGARRWRRPGSVLWRPAETSHRVDLEPGREAWSLVLVGRKVRPWGFWTVDGWQPWSPGYSPICESGEEATR